MRCKSPSEEILWYTFFQCYQESFSPRSCSPRLHHSSSGGRWGVAGDSWWLIEAVVSAIQQQRKQLFSRHKKSLNSRDGREEDERKKKRMSVKVKQTWPVAGRRARANNPRERGPASWAFALCSNMKYRTRPALSRFIRVSLLNFYTHSQLAILRRPFTQFCLTTHHMTT